MALTFDGSDNGEVLDWSDVSAAGVALVMLCAAVIGAIIGAALGGLQSMVWRRVARGSRFWIRMTALSGGIAILILLAATSFLPGTSRLGIAVILECTGLAGGILSTLIMVPALRRLRPRG